MLKLSHQKPMLPARVVVMGARGFVGGAICRRAGQAKVPVLALGREDIDLLADDAAGTLAQCLKEGDVFVAVSARAPVKDANMLIENLTMARSMVGALRLAGDKVTQVVNISSDAVYADTPVPLTEASPMAPWSYHGAMHLAREIMFDSDLAVPLAMLRPTLIYGAEDPHNGYGPNRFSRLARAGESIRLFGQGEERRDHIHIADVAELAWRLILHRAIGALNAATGEAVSFHEIAEMVSASSEKPVSIEPSERTGPMPHNGFRPFDVTACHAAFPDFRPVPLQIGIAEMIRRIQG